MLVIFDVDGTLIDGEVHDWACFNRAIASVLGFAPDRGFFSALPEITAQAIAEVAIRSVNSQLGAGLEARIRDEYFRGLKEVHAAQPGAFPARAGVPAMLAQLASLPDVTVAIATGDWHPTISYKLAAAGIEVAGYPMATSSDSHRRSEIIKLAAQRANRPLAEAVYVGDGVWDYKACQELGLSFIGTGSRPHLLREAGARYVFEDFAAKGFVSLVQTAVRANR